jgi:hypothetical protein
MIRIGFPSVSQIQSSQIQIEKEGKPQSIAGKEVEPTKKKKFPLLTVVLCATVIVGVVIFVACKSPAEPDDSNWPHDYEIMYERVLKIINPDADDVDRDRASLWGIYGGQSSSFFTKIEENKWIARFPNVYDEDSTQHVYLNDQRVVKLVRGEIIPSVARNIYMRGDGTTEWILLTHIDPNGLHPGEWAAVILKGGKVQNPY